ncbi:hypothetical protein SLA2020_368620 [Shorea laevis]
MGDWSSSFVVCFSVFFSSALFLLLSRWKSSYRKLPPGLPGWPIIGNLLDLGHAPHQALTRLRDKYSDVIWLKLGALNTMVIVSTKAATELFKNHDPAFADRTLTLLMSVHDYHKGSVALAQYGSYWRVMRRLVSTDMLTIRRINETVSLRRKCLDNMLMWIEEEVRRKPGQAIHVARFVFLLGFSLLGNMMLSRDLVDSQSKEVSEFFEAVNRVMETSGYANMADYFPWLRWLDPQGLEKKMKKELGKAIEIASNLVRERIEEKKLATGEERKKDFLDLLLEFRGNGKDELDKFSDHEVIIFILELFMAGGETTSSSIEWAMTELLRHPEALTKAKVELADVVGPNRKLEEADIDSLPYLNAVVKETLRLHPPLPFLVPRKAIEDTNFMGYNIPKNAQVFVNVWATGRDPEMWDDPWSFKPERFLGLKTDYKGQDFELIPFGAGRRICAGLPLAHRMLHLVLGSLLHHFDWELENGITKETVNMEDRLAITMRKLQPLLAIPKITATTIST